MVKVGTHKGLSGKYLPLAQGVFKMQNLCPAFVIKGSSSGRSLGVQLGHRKDTNSVKLTELQLGSGPV